jgi:hypothetical protein
MGNFKAVYVLYVLLRLVGIANASFEGYESSWMLEHGESASYHPLITKEAAQALKNKIGGADSKWVQNVRTTLSYELLKGNDKLRVSTTLFKDCLDQDAYGLGVSRGKMVLNQRVYMGVALGLYMIDAQGWEDAGFYRYWWEFSEDRGLVPIAGAELNINLFKHKNVEINFNNYLNPLVTNHYLAFGVRF